MSRAWMPLFIGDYLRDTMDLSTLEHGAYLLLIMHYWQNGSLPETTAGLAKISRLPWSTFRDHESRLARFFEQPGWRHKRIDAELAKADKANASRRLAGSIGGTRKKILDNKRTSIRQSRNQANGLPHTKKERKEESETVATPSDKLPAKQTKSVLSPSSELINSMERRGWINST